MGRGVLAIGSIRIDCEVLWRRLASEAAVRRRDRVLCDMLEELDPREPGRYWLPYGLSFRYLGTIETS